VQASAGPERVSVAEFFGTFSLARRSPISAYWPIPARNILREPSLIGTLLTCPRFNLRDLVSATNEHLVVHSIFMSPSVASNSYHLSRSHDRLPLSLTFCRL